MAFEVEFSKRLDLFGAEIFAALNDKKVALEAQGKKLYNLSVGTPDFEPMPHIKQALCDAAMVSENWKYSLRDLPELLDTVCAYYKRRFDVDGITPDQIMSFNGSQDGMGHMGPCPAERRRCGAAAGPLLPGVHYWRQAGRRRAVLLPPDQRA